jgi:positive regulator of sigma E activity
MQTLVLMLAIAMVAPLPFEEIVGGYGRLALAVLGFLLIFRWLFKNDQKKDLNGEL